MDAITDADYPYAVATASTHRDLAQKLRAAISAEALTSAGFQSEPDLASTVPPTMAHQAAGASITWLAAGALMETALPQAEYRTTTVG